jgi:hypothetical protein
MKQHMAQAIRILLGRLGQYLTEEDKSFYLSHSCYEYHVYPTCSEITTNK